MRDEVERVVAEEGWTKAAIGKMYKVDSFLRESQRLHGVEPLTLGRKVVAPEGFTFSHGTTMPYGSFVSVAGMALHYDQENYDNAADFDGFRFRACAMSAGTVSATTKAAPSIAKWSEPLLTTFYPLAIGATLVPDGRDAHQATTYSLRVVSVAESPGKDLD
ncbi:hypothetical protein DFH09DRAFT_1312618 [Mycena vulgaris]|nr:hypothetical protein DFH09DRAFT_1312618 [Mycena vulgaris]